MAEQKSVARVILETLTETIHERDRYSEALEDIASGASDPAEIAARALQGETEAEA